MHGVLGGFGRRSAARPGQQLMGRGLLTSAPRLVSHTVTAGEGSTALTTPNRSVHYHHQLLAPTPRLLGRRMRGRRTRHREPNPGDWLCQCGETNYRSKRECFKCGAPAPPLPPGVRRPSLPGEDPHDWACPCGQMNFRGSVACYKCAQPKPVPPGAETVLWTCPGCKGINRENRKTCFKCGAVSPQLTAAAAVGSIGAPTPSATPSPPGS